MAKAASDFRIPVIRHFIACERIDTKAGSGQYSLINIIHAIKPLPATGYPRIQPLLGLFAHLTDGRGSHPFQIQQVSADYEQSTYTSAPVILDLGKDPLIVHGWPIRLKNVFFPHAGLYEFRLLCDGQVIAREAIVLRENP